MVVEGVEDIAQTIQFRLGPVRATCGRDRSDLRVVVGQRDFQGGLLLDAVTVHVDGFESPKFCFVPSATPP